MAIRNFLKTDHQEDRQGDSKITPRDEGMFQSDYSIYAGTWDVAIDPDRVRLGGRNRPMDIDERR